MDSLSQFLTSFYLSNRPSALDPFMSLGADYIIYLSLGLSLILAIKSGSIERKAMAYILIAIPLVVVLIKLIHVFIYTDRPFVNYDFDPLVAANIDASFPSRHVAILSAVSFAYLLTKSHFAAIQLVLLMWVGIARVYSGVHYPIDILGGIIIGIVAVLIAKKIVKFITHS